MTSRNISQVGEQTVLLLARHPKQVDVPVEMVRSRKNKGAAFTLSCEQRYEAAKIAWIATHPDATPEQYQAAMRELARRVGL